MILHVVLEEVFFKSPTREGTARKVPLRESLVLFAVNANEVEVVPVMLSRRRDRTLEAVKTAM